MKNIVVSDIMTQEPVTIDVNSTLLDCAKKMVKKRVSSLIITNKKKLAGLITDRDILWAMIKKPKKELADVKAIEISPRKIYTFKPSTPIEDAIKKMKSKKFERFPVVHKGEVVGMLTVKDIISYNPEFFPEFKEIEGIKEYQEKMKRIKAAKKRGYVKEGICERCGKKDLLRNFNGMYICEECELSL